MDLTVLWFGLVVFFWAGYLVLDGFDFGVGILAPVLGRSDERRGELLATIGPHWDGNEVWLVVATGSVFAAFPGWYADLTSANYLVLSGVLVALIVRGVALEYRGKRSDELWHRRCDVGIAVGSVGAPLGLGTVLSGSVLGGVVLVGLCVVHGHTYLRSKSGGGAWGFVGTTLLVGLCTVATMVLVYDLDELRSLAASTYGLQVLTWATVAIMPFVLLYQGWSYWALRRGRSVS